MKRTLILIALCTFAFAATSCRKDDGTIHTPDNDMSVTANITISKDDSNDKTVTMFRSSKIYKKSDFEGKSRFFALSGGKMVYDAFSLSIYFDNIDTLNPGDTIIPSECLFLFIFSSDSNARAYDYKGKITIANKGKDHVILDFHKVKFDCSFGEYTIDGYLKCPLCEDFNE